MPTKARLTAEDLWKLGTGDARRELVDGEIIEMTPAGGTHGWLMVELSSRLRAHVELRGGGVAIAGNVGFVLGLPQDPERVRAPDVAFVATDRLPGGQLPQGFIPGAPDLAVEILSPNDDPVEVQQKVRDYLEAGSRLVWVVAPRARTVTVYRPDGSARLVREPGGLEGEDVLPGFALPLAALFR
jgi:Uma2 family endonuclease